MIVTMDHANVTFARVDDVKRAVGEIPYPDDSRWWILGQPITVRVDDDGTVTTVEIPKGFTTDGASIPWYAQLVTRWYPWDEPQRWAAIVHDWLYHQHIGHERAWCDRVFLAVLDNEGASWLRATLMFVAVRVFAGSAWRFDQTHPPEIHP